MTRSRDEGRETLDRAWEGLEEETPDRVSRMIRWLREPRARWIRLPIGLPPIAQSFMFFLPFAGIEFLP
ncbi:MAG TPA: hypothetical protein VEA81_00375, partial [Burkholderiaceae bacterium]|nr:hypothetical protein [Burkholderiaceae bacterium]